MIAIDKPYVSDFLIKTIKNNNFPVIDTPAAREMMDDDSLNWISEEDAKSRIKETPNTPIYTNSENTISWIEKNIDSPGLLSQIQFFKNKIKFRKLISDSFPNYFFKAVAYNELQEIDIRELKFPFIIKPAVGFFSIAVHIVNNEEEWHRILELIKVEIEETKNLYPAEVIDTSDFILEELIQGDEFAVDCYFNNDGEAVILNILHHIFSSEKDVSDRVYSTSKEIIENNIESVQAFLEILGDKTNLRNFPMHVEVRIGSDGKINPIEVNPLRFGGFCTTGDLSWYAYEINSYEYFFNSRIPDWKEIFKGREQKKYSIIVLDNNSGYRENEIDTFNYDLLAKDFENPLNIREINFNQYLVFGFVFLETRKGNEKEIEHILNSDLRKYIKLKQP